MVSSRRRPIERPPSKIAGLVYLLIGVFALVVAALVLFYEGTFTGPVTNFRTGFGIVIALYGVFRLFTGVSMIRKAGGLKGSFTFPGQNTPPSNQPPQP
ncbi:MAG TPA: hypothetical protein VGM92_05140 [Candidatus Kapabacteria bacterium]|jgi:hypothetical protein